MSALVDDDYVADQLGEAFVLARRAYRRARNEKAAQALQDQKLMDQLTGAARSLQSAVRALGGEEPPPSRRGRTVRRLLLALALGAAAAWWDSRQP
jgi:hypothetical protein